jgi:hypothetical protein
MTPEKQMRVIQICFVAYAVLLIGLAYYLPAHATQKPNAVFQIIFGLLAVLCAFGGLLFPKMIARAASKPMQSGKVATPVQRWRTGHILRFAFHVSIVLYGFVLHMLGGATWLVNSLFAIGLILLVYWKPGRVPAASPNIPPPNR